MLSGGQKQRVALARALASQPRLLALDEPLGALDALTRIEMQDLIECVWRDKGFTTIVVTHDVTEAVSLADRILLIEEGRIALDVAVGSARPRRRAVQAISAAHLARSCAICCNPPRNHHSCEVAMNSAVRAIKLSIATFPVTNFAAPCGIWPAGSA